MDLLSEDSLVICAYFVKIHNYTRVVDLTNYAEFCSRKQLKFDEFNMDGLYSKKREVVGSEVVSVEPHWNKVLSLLAWVDFFEFILWVDLDFFILDFNQPLQLMVNKSPSTDHRLAFSNFQFLL